MIDAPPPSPVAQVPGGDPAAHLRQIRWSPALTRHAPLVAVLDTGVDPSAPALAGAVDTRRARTFAPGGGDPLEDPEGHGTHVAATIAGVAAGPGGPGVRILPVTVAGPDGVTTTRSLVRGIRYATAARARVINISFGGRGFSAAEQAAIDDASRAGALVVVAAGNTGERGGPPEYPAAYRQVLAVAALGREDRALAISARGPHIALAAPGQAVAARVAPGRGPAAHEPRTGTSMAAAVTSGVAARAWARRPAMSAQQVRTLLESTARDVPPAGRDVGTGAGAVDLRAALAARIPPPEDPEPNDDPALAARTAPLLPPGGPGARAVRGRVGSWGDPRDGFRVHLRAGERLVARLAGPAWADLDLVAWRVGAPGGRRTPAFGARWIAAASLGPDSSEVLDLRATRTGFHTVEVQGSRGPAPYRLHVRRMGA